MAQQRPREIPYTIRRSSRARRVRVNVHAHSGVEVVLPARAPERAAAAAVSELRPWIEGRLEEAQRVLARIAARAGTVPYLGSKLELVPQRGRDARAPRRRAAARARRRPAPGARALVPPGRPQGDRAAAGPRDRARRQPPTAAWRIRAQRTRWASCSASGRMSFNWRLLLAPERVLEYVVWHEVCHLEILDHSPRFWALLERRWPDYRADREWLSRHGATLVL